MRWLPGKGETVNGNQADNSFISTPMGRFQLQQGYIKLFLDHEELCVQDMENHIAMMLDFSQARGEVSMPVLIDFNRLARVASEARWYAIEILRPEWNERVALFYHNPYQKLVASVLAGLNRGRIPMFITGDEEEAGSWLRGEVPGGQLFSSRDSGGQGRLGQVVDSMARVYAGDLSVEHEHWQGGDEIDAIGAGVAMLAEEIGRLSGSMSSGDNPVREAQMKKLEAVIAARTRELKDVNVVLREEISQRSRAEEELRKKNIELEGFARNVAHDLKGLVTSVSLGVSTISRLLQEQGGNLLPDEVNEIGELIVSYSGRMVEMVDDMLALAGAGQVPASVEPVDIRDLVEDIIREKLPVIALKKVRINAEDDLGEILASPTHVYQVFANLIANALDHCDSIAPEIRVQRLQTGEESVHRYLVRDNGSGIHPDEMDSIFIPFYRGATGNTGIGLPIVAKIVKVYQGYVCVYNDQGACFEFVMKDYRLESEDQLVPVS